MPVKGTRRQARGVALQALYEIDSGTHSAATVVDRLVTESELSEENQSFVRQLINGVVTHKAEIDENIRRFAKTWPLEQISVVDRNILRLAIFEILFDNNVSVRIAINEAVELAKKFGGDSSPRFINGVLGSVSALAKR